MRPPAYDVQTMPSTDLPADAGGHFVLSLYAAIFRLVNHLRRLAELSDATLEQAFERYPFLGEYFLEMRPRMPEGLTWTDGLDWWREQIRIFERRCEGRCEVHLPLLALDRVADLSADADEEGCEDGTESAEDGDAGAALGFAGRLAFMAIGLVEEDSRFGTIFAELQQPLDAPPSDARAGGPDHARRGPSGRRRPLEPVPAAPRRRLRRGDPTDGRRVPSGCCARRRCCGTPPAGGSRRGRRAGRASGAAGSCRSIEELIVTDDLRDRLQRIPDLLSAGTGAFGDPAL